MTGWDWRASKRPVDQEWQAVINERGASLCREFLTAALEPLPDQYDISEEEFAAAKAHVIAKYGELPPSLQRVIERGGRFGMPRARGT